ncbi:MAG: hypothetical protein H8M99_01115 [Gloeobacteraceae cyanobacterium ES-bin-144]|nr:hypothetical protein [Verrucomicrobiales bacterium]
MHRLRSQSAITRIRVVALLVSLKALLIPLSIGVFIYSMMIRDYRLTLISLGLLVLYVIVAIVSWMLSSRTNCPLCLTPVLANKSCSKHRDARSLFSSYRLKVALAVLFKNSFRCPYCNEPTILEVRRRGTSR